MGRFSPSVLGRRGSPGLDSRARLAAWGALTPSYLLVGGMSIVFFDLSYFAGLFVPGSECPS